MEERGQFQRHKRATTIQIRMTRAANGPGTFLERFLTSGQLYVIVIKACLSDKNYGLENMG